MEKIEVTQLPQHNIFNTTISIFNIITRKQLLKSSTVSNFISFCYSGIEEIVHIFSLWRQQQNFCFQEGSQFCADTLFFMKKFVQQIINSEGRIKSTNESNFRDDQNVESQISTTARICMCYPVVQMDRLSCHCIKQKT